MKYLAILLFLFSSCAKAITVNPDEQPGRTITCNPPTEYTNGTPIPDTDSLMFRFYQEANGSAPVIIGVNNECRLPIDLSEYEDGTYHFTVVVISSGGGVSARSSAYHEIIVQRPEQVLIPAEVELIESH